MTYNPTWWYRERDAEVCRICEAEGIEAAVDTFHLAWSTIQRILRFYGVKALGLGVTRGMKNELVRMGGQR